MLLILTVLLDNWLEEIVKHVQLPRYCHSITNDGARHVMPGTIRWHKYHGMMRQINLQSIGS